MKKTAVLFASLLFMTVAMTVAKAQNSPTTPGLNSAPPTANSPTMTNTGTPGLPGNNQNTTSPMSSDRQTTFPESTSTGQLNAPTTEELNRQRTQMNQRRDQIRNQANCSTIADVTARANCESQNRTN